MKKHLLLLMMIFIIGNIYAYDILKVTVTYTANGVSKSEDLLADETKTINRDKGTQISIRIYKSSTAPTPSDFYYACFPTGGGNIQSSTSSSVLFSNIGDALTNQILCSVNTNQGVITIKPVDLPSGYPDLVLFGIKVDGSLSSSNEEFIVGQTIDIDCYILNNGQIDAGAHRTGFYIGTSNSDYSNRFDYNSTGSTPIKPSYMESESTTFTFLDTDVGTRYFNFWADYQDVIEEGTGDGNNKSSWGPFTVKKAPLVVSPTVITNSITNITQTTATGGGNVTSDGGATVTARGVCWSTSQNPTTSNSKTSDGTGTGTFTSSVTGLTANTTYYVRAYATNSSGTAYGNQVSFTTLKAITTPTVTTNSISNITQTTATGGGNVTSDGGAPVTARGVCWSTSHNPTISNSKTSDGTGTGSFTSSLTGLTANTTYYVRAYATNSAGTGYGQEVPFSTFHNVIKLQEFHPALKDGNIIDFGINKEITIDFTDNLNASSVNSQSIKLYCADSNPVSFTTTYESKTLLHNSRIIIKPSNLEYQKLYILEVSEPLTDINGNLVDIDVDGKFGGKIMIGIQTEFSSSYESEIKSTVDNQTFNYISELTYTNKKRDLWALVNPDANKIISIKNNIKTQLLNEGIKNFSFYQNSDHLYDYIIDGKTYRIKGLQFLNNQNSNVYLYIAFNDKGNIVKDVETLYKIELIRNNRGSKFDKEFLEENKKALANLAVLQLIQSTLLTIRDGAVGSIFSLPGNQISAFAKGVVNSLKNDLPALYLKVFLQLFNTSLRTEYKTAIDVANNQVYPMTRYEDVSYLLYSEFFLYEYMWDFVELTDKIWENDGNLLNQLEAVTNGIRDGLVDELIPLSKNLLADILRVSKVVFSSSTILSGLANNYIYFGTFNNNIKKYITDHKESFINYENVAKYLVAAEIYISSGINTIENTSISIYPNPAAEKIIIKPSSDINSEVILSVNDVTGKLLYSMSKNELLSNEPIEIDISTFTKGVYFLRLTNSNSVITEKIIKQ